MALEEDLRPRGDITTNLVKSKNEMIKARIIAKQDGIVAGLELIRIVSIPSSRSDLRDCDPE